MFTNLSLRWFSIVTVEQFFNTNVLKCFNCNVELCVHIYKNLLFVHFSHKKYKTKKKYTN